MFDNLRLWLIKKLAGNLPIVTNLHVCGCDLCSNDNDNYAHISFEEMANSNIEALKNIPKKLAAE